MIFLQHAFRGYFFMSGSSGCVPLCSAPFRLVVPSSFRCVPLRSARRSVVVPLVPLRSVSVLFRFVPLPSVSLPTRSVSFRFQKTLIWNKCSLIFMIFNDVLRFVKLFNYFHICFSIVDDCCSMILTCF